MVLKKSTGLRLTEEAKALLKELAERRGLSQTGVVETLIREDAERRGISLPFRREVKREGEQ